MSKDTESMETSDTMSLAAFALDARRAHDDPWHQLATGERTPEQVAEMRQFAEPKEDIERKLELFGPTSKEVGDQRLDLLLARFYGPDSGTQGSPASGHGGSEPADVVSLHDASDRRQDRSWSVTSIATIVALAAAIMLVWVMRPPADPEHASFVPFELRLEDGWTGDMRGSEPASAPQGCDERYHRQHALSIRLTPAEALAEQLWVAGLARSEAGEDLRLDLSPKITNKGVIKIDEQVADLGLTPGRWTLTFFVSRQGQRHDLDALTRLEPGIHPGVTVVRGSVCIVE